MADQPSTTTASKKRKVLTDAKGSFTEAPIQPVISNGSHSDPVGESPQPKLLHKVKNKRSILALAVADAKIYAGTQGGEILVQGSVLGLFIPTNIKLLFSSGGDALVNWYDLSQKDTRPLPDLASHPSQRNHRFFDSKGPGGVRTPRSSMEDEQLATGGQTLEIHKDHILQYAHYGYVYCMLLASGLYGDQEILLSGGGDGAIKLWQLDQMNCGAITPLASLENGDDSVLALALNGTILYGGRLEGEIHVWDLDTRQLIRRVKAHSVDVLALSVGQGLILSGGANGIAKKFNSRYECVGRWEAHEQLILASATAAYKGMDIYITGGNDNSIAIWDIGVCAQARIKHPESSNEELLESLKRFVYYRTVSSKPEYTEDCRRGASWLRNLFKRFGADTEMLNTEDNRNPVVYARFHGKMPKGKAKRILFYGHYDIVSADNKQQTWDADPFDMQSVNGYVYGRGVSDNKGPVLAAVYAVADLLTKQQLNSDIVFLIEGEEESGSRGFERAVQKNKELIGGVDWIILANSYWLDDYFPCLTYGLRGVVHATVRIESKRPDLHSGVDGSYLLNEALKDLVAVIAALSGPRGRVQIPGFYDSVLAVTAEENERFDAISKTLLEHNPKLGDVRRLTESFKARWTQPSLTIHHTKTSGAPTSSIIPRSATAALSVRLVPNQSAMAIQNSLDRVIREAFDKLESSNKVFIDFDHTADPWLGDPSNEIFTTLEEAVIEAWRLGEQEQQKSDLVGRATMNELTRDKSKAPPKTSSTLGNGSERSSNDPAIAVKFDSPSLPEQKAPLASPRKPLYIREGGSIPAIRFLEKEFNAPAAHLPCGQASDSAHLDNERIRISNLYKSREIFRKVFRDLHLKELLK
ncbi:MAG: hypothetical protein Q9191_006325 [Dirinaria sp. TL-2023a]